MVGETQAKMASVSPGDFWTTRRFALVLALLIFATFPRIVAGLESFVFRDYALFGYPLAHYYRECFWRGEIPLWNPYNNSGLPFLAQWNTLVCYPLSIIYLILPLPWSLGIFCLFHLWLGGVGMFCLARSWTNHSFAAVLAGVGFAFSGLTLSCLIWPAIIATLAWSPWVLWVVPRAWSSGGRQIISAAFVSALQMLAGGPEVLLLTWFVLGALFLVSLTENRAEVWPKLRRCFCHGLLFLGLIAVQLLPFLDLLSHSQRHSSFGGTEWSMPPWGWANFFLPLFYTDRTSAGVHVQPEQGWVSSYYLGLAVMAWAITGVCWVRERVVRMLGALLLMSIVFALGSAAYLYPLLQNVLPFLGFMQFPVKWVVLAAIVTPLLAAIGLDQLSRTERAWKHQFVLCALFTVGVVAILAFAKCFPYFPDDSWNKLLFNGGLRIGLLGVIVLLAWGALRTLHSPRAILGTQVLLLLFVWLDHVTHVPRQNPGVPSQAYTAALPPLAELEPRPAPGVSRVVLSLQAFQKSRTTIVSNISHGLIGARLGLHENCNLLADIPKVDGFYPLYLPHEIAVRKHLYRSETELHQPLANFLAISHTTKPGTFWDWIPRPTCSPMITAGQLPVYLDNASMLNELINPEFDSRRTVYLAPDAKRLVPPTLTTNITVQVKEFSSHLVTIDYSAAGDALILVAQTHYHRWKAYVKGTELPIIRANHAFQAVQVPPGKRRLILKYEDLPTKLGAMISAISFIGGMAGFIAWRRLETRLHSSISCRSPRQAAPGITGGAVPTSMPYSASR